MGNAAEKTTDKGSYDRLGSVCRRHDRNTGEFLDTIHLVQQTREDALV